MQAVWTFLNDENGASAIEYALLASMIGVAAAAAMGTLGSAMPGPYQAATASLS